MKNLFTLVLSFFLVACSITPEMVSRNPEVGLVSNAGIGDILYSYDKVGQKYTDYMTGQTTYWTDSVRQELIYSGISKGVLKITYREYVNDYARASFFQEASYDFVNGEESMIGFKGAKIKVMNADNTSINYQVVNGFSNEKILISEAK